MAAGEGKGAAGPTSESEGPGEPRWSWKMGEDCSDPPALLCIASTHGSYVISLSSCFVCVFSHSAVSDSLRPHGLHPTRLLCPRDSPGKNTGVGGHFLL